MCQFCNRTSTISRMLTFLSVVAATSWRSTDTESSVQHPDAHVEGFVVTVHLDLQAFGAGLDGLR